MQELSYTLRSIPSWYELYKSEVKQEEWKARYINYELKGGRLTAREVDYVLAELADYERLRDARTGIQVLYPVTAKLNAINNLHRSSNRALKAYTRPMTFSPRRLSMVFCRHPPTFNPLLALPQRSTTS